MPGLDIRSPADYRVQCFFSNLRVRIGQERRDRRLVTRRDDGIANGFANIVSAGNGAEDARIHSAGNNLQKVVISQQDRVLKDRRGDDELEIPGEALDNVIGRFGCGFQLLRNDLPDPRPGLLINLALV